MTLKDMKKKVLSMIEELDPDSEYLTSDPDLANKINNVINQVMYEVARMKKIPGYVEMEVSKDDLVRYEDIEQAGGYGVYQIDTVSGSDYELKASGTIIKALEDGILEIDYFCYPELIDEKTKDGYEFELSADALEVMPYGVAADLLKSDVSANYGQIYSQRYETMLQRLDSRYTMGGISIEGGVDV